MLFHLLNLVHLEDLWLGHQSLNPQTFLRCHQEEKHLQGQDPHWLLLNLQGIINLKLIENKLKQKQIRKLAVSLERDPKLQTEFPRHQHLLNLPSHQHQLLLNLRS